ncbi:hypothetical protein ATP_00267 [Candidatus Phytoplasma mali]|uniref:Transmembrane protein n=1 Tax=Phytoplasma mali (strain AT) TaxID=482235 RepID=B3QZR7_PHYMT|nr:hypothetical protein [Candidatus Phytoplasma mali]CAP18454.1 hypothetical protein ATP_00267 [Candidatus Phytoplasma mali]
MYTLKNITIKLNFEIKELLEKNYKEDNLIELKFNFINFNNIYEKILENKIEETKTEAQEIINKIEKKIKSNEITKDEKQKANILIQNLKNILETSNISKIKLKINHLWIFDQEILLFQEIEEAKNTAILNIENSRKYLKLFENEFSSYQKKLIQNQIKELEYVIKQKKIPSLKIDQKTLKLAQILEQVINNKNIQVSNKNKKILNIKKKYFYKNDKKISNKSTKNYFYFFATLIIINITLIMMIKIGIIKFIKKI